MSDEVKLKVIKGSKQGKEFTFNQHDTFLFGRKGDCHICLPGDRLVSRHHFILEVNPPDVRIRDLGSKNGTWVNEEKYGGRGPGETPEEGAQRQYPEVDLHNDDEIRVGATVLRVNVDLAAVCVECGEMIPEQAHDLYTWVGDTYLCAACRQKLAEERKHREAKPKAPPPVRCQVCGKDVSAEVGARRRGNYVCRSCRQQIQANPAIQLRVLLQQAPHQAQPAFNLPDYDIERKVGEGGMGAVYLARHKQQGSRCALKVMLPKVAFNEKAREQFLREVENTRALRHDNFVEYLDHGAIGPIFYFLMVFYEGGNIADLIARRGGDVPLNEAWPIMLQTLQGLAFAHAAGFVHRDLKPQNILLDGRENAWTAKVADLGVMKDFEKAGLSGMTVTGSVIGTYPFMPREQLVNFKYVKPVSDVWSVGATFYNMLTGQYPRETRRGQDPMMVVLRNHAVPIRQRMSSIPSRVAQILDRALATKTDARYQNAGEMLRALEAAL